MSTPRRVSIAFPTVCVLAMASSCATTTETVEGEDGSAFALAARARIPTASEPRANAAGVTTTSEVRVEVSTASGSDVQDVEAGHQLDCGGLFVPGPARVASDFEARELDVVFAPTVALDASMSFTPSFGFVLVEREVRLRSGAQSGRDDARAEPQGRGAGGGRDGGGVPRAAAVEAAAGGESGRAARGCVRG